MNKRYNGQDGFGYQPLDDVNNEENDLTFILSVIEELSVNSEDYDFGPSCALAQDRKKLAIIKLNRMIRQLKLDRREN